MLRMRLIVLTILGITLAIPGVARAQRMQCPSGGTPPPGTAVDGGLDVDGICVVDQVTVNGGIIVQEGGHLQLTSGTVNGGIVTLPCGELDVNATTLGAGIPTGTISTINGGIDITASPTCTVLDAFSDLDVRTAKIDGGISITGTFVFSPQVCDNTIIGGVHVDNAIALPGSDIGDARVGENCPGNIITGSVHISNSSFIDLESNTIGGSVLLSGSKLEFNGNTINGSAMCSDGTVILPGEQGDPSCNTVHGKNTCS